MVDISWMIRPNELVGSFGIILPNWAKWDVWVKSLNDMIAHNWVIGFFLVQREDYAKFLGTMDKSIVSYKTVVQI